MTLWKRIRMWRRRRSFEADLAEEVRIHREMAGAAAFGSVALTLETSREVWGFAWLDSWKQDIRYAGRGLRKSPGFALAVIGAIGLGIGLNTTIFTIFNAYVLRPFAVHDPYSLYHFTRLAKNGGSIAFTTAEFAALTQQQTAFSGVLAYRGFGGQIEGESAFGQTVSGNYFAMLGVGMAQGRPLLPDDRGQVIVVSHAAWRNRFAEDPGLVGRRLYLRGVPFEVVGIARPGFSGLEAAPVTFWIPFDAASSVMEGALDLQVIGRLKPDLSVRAANQMLLAWAHAASPEVSRVLLDSGATMLAMNREMIWAFLPLFAAFALVLAIACANVSNMMLARALARQREVAIRVSLGAGRARLIRQLLTESVLLALPSAVAGFAIAEATLQGALRLMFATLPAAFARVVGLADLAPDWRVFGFVLAASVATALLFGLAPAIQTTRTRLVEANRGDFSSDHRPARLRNLLVCAQVAVCSVLLICTVVVLRSERRVAGRQSGLNTHDVWDLRMLPRYQPKAMSHLAAEPAVEAVAEAWRAPVFGQGARLAVVPSGGNHVAHLGYNLVSSAYFSVLRLGLVRGRGFTEEESDAEAPVVVVSETAASRLWPAGEAIGQTISIPPVQRLDSRFYRAPRFRAATVIGVVKDAINGFAFDDADARYLYFPTNARAPFNESVLVRMKGDPGGARRSLQAALDQVAPSVSDLIVPMDDIVAAGTYPFRVTWWVAGFLGGVALLMTVSGIYGVMSYLVSQRTKEIGVRVALGASSADVVRMVLRQSARLAVAGVVVGVGLALAAAPFFAHVVEVLNPYDWTAYAVPVAVILAAAVAASYAPARRAAGVDPAVTLRGD